jgi:hypothetical protein
MIDRNKPRAPRRRRRPTRAAQLANARRLLTAGLDCIAAAAKIDNDLAAGNCPTSARGQPGGYETAIMPAGGEPRTAG